MLSSVPLLPEQLFTACHLFKSCSPRSLCPLRAGIIVLSDSADDQASRQKWTSRPVGESGGEKSSSGFDYYDSHQGQHGSSPRRTLVRHSRHATNGTQKVGITRVVHRRHARFCSAWYASDAYCIIVMSRQAPLFRLSQLWKRHEQTDNIISSCQCNSEQQAKAKRLCLGE